MKECQTCAKEIEGDHVYCSRSCVYRRTKHNIQKACVVCNKIFSIGLYAIKNPHKYPKRYCSRQCAGTVTGILGGKAAVAVNRKNKVGLFNPENYSTLYSSAQQSEKGKKGALANKLAGTGGWDPKVYKSMYLGFVSHSHYKWQGIGFSTVSEMKCARMILSKPILKLNCHIFVGRKVFDFFPQITDRMFFGMFVEFHPIVFHQKMGFSDETFIEYYAKRRTVLDENSFRDKPLVVLNSLSDMPKELPALSMTSPLLVNV